MKSVVIGIPGFIFPTSLDGGNNALSKLVGKMKPGDEAKLKVYHRGEEKEVAVTLGESQS